MIWITPSKRDTDADTLENRLWDAVENVEQLDVLTRARFTAKRREREKGPWHKLAMRLGLARV